MTSPMTIRLMLSAILLVGIALSPGMAVGQHEPLPEALAPFEALLPEHDEIVLALRDYERHQLAALESLRARIQEATLQEDSDAVQELVAEAREELEQVRLLYKAALAHHPESAPLHNYLGEFLYDSLAEQEEGLKLWEEAIALDDTESRAFNNLGIHYFHVGEYVKGLEYLDRVLELDDDNPDYLFNMAQMHHIHTPQIAEIRDEEPVDIYRQGLAYSKRAAEVAPEDFSLQRDYAMNFFASERFDIETDWEEAARAWQQARNAAARPDEVFMTWLNEGRAWIRAERYESAIVVLEAALEIHPNSNAAQQLLEEAREAL